MRAVVSLLSAAVLGCVVALGSAGCRSGGASSAESVKVIFDTDMYTDYDDAGALGLLHKLARRSVRDPGDDLKDERNPVRDVYRSRLDPKSEGHQSWDLVTVLVAVRGVEFFANAEHGRYEITDDKGTSVWHPDPTARDCRLVEKDSFRAVGALIDSFLTRR